MTQQKNFGFGADEAMLRDAAAKFFTDHASADQIHRQVANNYDIHRPIECIWDQVLWRQMVELGWTAACVPEAAGGIGMSLVAAVALTEEAGKAAFPSPLQTTFNATFVLNACSTEASQTALGDIARGSAATLAITNAQGSWSSSDNSVAVTNGKLNGTAWFVQDAQKADFYIVAGTADNGIGLYTVPKGANGLTLTPDGIIDLTRDQAHLTFDEVSATEVCPPGQGDHALQRALPALLCINAADMVGAGEWLLQTTTEYATTRVQFERPLGFFQAVKHPLVNVMLEIDAAKSLTYNAACAFTEEPEKAEQCARMAKSAASDMAVFSASRAVQFHGGIGFTWECYVQLFFKRQMHSQMLYGDAKYQRAKLADLLMGAAA